jgi:hypothetical protein
VVFVKKKKKKKKNNNNNNNNKKEPEPEPEPEPAEDMTVASPGQLNLDETPSWGSRSVDFFEKIEQIGEGTYGYGIFFISQKSFCFHFFLLLQRDGMLSAEPENPPD